jgi:LuxR family transcriptional regulator, quorum-sensing system regulator CciR
VADLGDVQKFIDMSAQVESFHDLDRLLADITREMGFDHFALIHHVDHRVKGPGTAVRLENYPSGWVNTFLEKELYARDPIHLASHRTNVGFAWSDVPSMIKMTKAHRQVLEAAGREGLGNGYTVPAHVPGEANGSCSFAMRWGRDLPDNLPMAQLVGSFAFQAARNLALRAFPNGVEDGHPMLTPRQLDCVLLIGQGKSDWEIAQILGLKEDTVTEYVDAARERYHVARRVQLVVRAIHSGQLALTDLVK